MQSSNSSSTLLSFLILSSFANLFRGNRAFELPKRAPLRPQTGSEANVLHRPVVAPAGGAPKSGDRLSPRGRLQEIQKKRSTRAVEVLEQKVGEAEEELKKLKAQLDSAVAAKLDAERALAMKLVEKDELVVASHGSKEVTAAEDKVQPVAAAELMEEEKDDEANSEHAVAEQKEEEEAMVALNALLLEKEKEVGILRQETAFFRARAAAEMAVTLAAALATEGALMAKLKSAEEELKQRTVKAELLTEQLSSAEREKTAAEAEMKRLRAQNEQWRKAAEAAAEALAEPGEWGPVSMAGEEEEGRRNSVGAWVFGDLWKKKPHQK
ncbi:hypothetical protein ZIOFF_037431 [Zingiber officinale]|uniref:Uncharacterized protein n=1 Tax=Zingiber officinale TaxID=94328 RepID=A0A8J5GBN6_ZINOF|nr:hypothetical protein ZIOFF_037431 [Zingiber officinale]